VRARLPILLAAALVLAGRPPAGAGAAPDCYHARAAEGPAPLTVTFTSTCGAVHWSFGDGAAADGEQVTHTYAARVARGRER
jgi:PKD domain